MILSSMKIINKWLVLFAALYYSLCVYAQNELKSWCDISESDKCIILSDSSLIANSLNKYVGCNSVVYTHRFLNKKLDYLCNDSSIITIPLRFHIFCYYLKCIGDEEIESIGLYCFDILLNNKLYVISQFHKDNELLRLFATYIGYELSFVEDGASLVKMRYSEFSDVLKTDENLSDFPSTILEFLQCTKSAIEFMN